MSAGLHSNAHEARHIPVMLDEVLSAPRSATAVLMSMARLGSAGIRAPFWTGRTPPFGRSTAIPKQSRAARPWWRNTIRDLTLGQGRFGEMTELLQQAGIERSTASYLTSASPRRRSTTPVAVFRSVSTVRSICGWRKPAWERR